MNQGEARLRRGRHNPWTIYVQLGPHAANDDTFIGAVRAPGFAALIVYCLNRFMAEHPEFDATTWREAQNDDRDTG